MDGISFYLDLFNKISEFYTNDTNEVIISKEIAELIENLKKNNDPRAVKKAITYVLSIFENYYLDDYNISSGVISQEAKKEIVQTLENEIVSDDFENAMKLNIDKISEQERQKIIQILKEELKK
ncbi:MAG: hypothetical protein ACTSR8_14790 [Promethearchaeota archaeon]